MIKQVFDRLLGRKSDEITIIPMSYEERKAYRKRLDRVETETSIALIDKITGEEICGVSWPLYDFTGLDPERRSNATDNQRLKKTEVTP